MWWFDCACTQPKTGEWLGLVYVTQFIKKPSSSTERLPSVLGVGTFLDFRRGNFEKLDQMAYGSPWA